MVLEDSLSYFDENFSAFQLFIMSLYAKFNHHHHKMMEDMYAEYMRTKMVVADSIFIDISDLEALYSDLDELDSVCRVADDTYDEDNEEYNDALEQLKGFFDRLNIDWLKETISEGGTLHQLVTFNAEEKANDILQEEYSSVAWDEYLDAYVEKAMDSAAEIYSVLHNAFKEVSGDFLAEIEKILFALKLANCFTTKWKVSKVNPEIDNT
jgi:hypothetical protein